MNPAQHLSRKSPEKEEKYLGVRVKVRVTP